MHAPWISSLLPLALLSGVLVGCVSDAPPVAPPTAPAQRTPRTDIRHALAPALDCCAQQVRTYDDGVSDARTIAQVLVAACVREFQALGAWGAQRTGPHSPYGRMVFLREMESTYHELALRVVLAERAAKRPQY